MKIKLNKKLLLYIYLYISYNYFYSENFYKFKSPLVNKELRIFSIRIKYFFMLYNLKFIFKLIQKFLQVQKIASEQRTQNIFNENKIK